MVNVEDMTMNKDDDTRTQTAPDTANDARRANRPSVKPHHGKRAPYIDNASKALSARDGLEATNTGSLASPDAAHLCIQNGMLFGTGNRLMWACRVMRRLGHGSLMNLNRP